MVLAPLSPFVAALVALGLAALLTLLTLATVRFLSQAPGIGPWIANKVTDAEHAVAHALSEAFAGIDSFIGGCIHTGARFLDHLWNVATGTAHALLQTAEALARLTGAVGAAHSLARHAAQVVHGIDRLQRTLEREFHGIEHRVRAVEHDLTRGIGHDLRLGLRTLRKELHDVRTKTIPGIQSDVRTAEGEITNLYDWARGKASLLGIGTFAAAVAAVLAKIGNGWLGCKENPFARSTNPCGLWSDLADLLGLATIAIAAADFQELVKEAQSLERDVTVAIKTLWNIE